MGGGVGRMTNHPDYYLSDGSVSFLTTENIRFRVHKTFFTRESEVFRDLFDSVADDGPQVGSDALPFRLDVTADEFAHLLWVWYDRDYCYQQQSKDRWVTVLRLSTRWAFPNIRALAIRELDALALSPAERISLYNKHDIDSDQLLSSYVELCKSPTVPSEADGQLMQMETLINVLQAREDAQRKAAELGHESPTSACLEDVTLRDIVSKFFKKGLSPRSNGLSTGSEVQASSLNGERVQGTSTHTTITLAEPQVPDRKVHPNSEATPQQKSDQADEGKGSREKKGQSQKEPTEATRDRDREKDAQTKEKAQQAQQKPSGNPRQRTRGN